MRMTIATGNILEREQMLCSSIAKSCVMLTVLLSLTKELQEKHPSCRSNFKAEHVSYTDFKARGGPPEATLQHLG